MLNRTVYTKKDKVFKLMKVKMSSKRGKNSNVSKSSGENLTNDKYCCDDKLSSTEDSCSSGAKKSKYFEESRTGTVTKKSKYFSKSIKINSTFDQETDTSLKRDPDAGTSSDRAVSSESTTRSAEGPANWEIVYANIREMRKEKTAPVDSMGCERAHDIDAEPKVTNIEKMSPKEIWLV
jgi:hypothetical protein